MKKNYFSSNIKYLRQVHKITQKELSLKINKTPNTVSNWEQGLRQPIVNDVITLCNFFDVDFIDLMETDLSISEESRLSQLLSFISSNNFVDYEIEQLLGMARMIVVEREKNNASL